MSWLEPFEENTSSTKAYELSHEDTFKGKVIDAFKKHCPCWSRFEHDRKMR